MLSSSDISSRRLRSCGVISAQSSPLACSICSCSLCTDWRKGRVRIRLYIYSYSILYYVQTHMYVVLCWYNGIVLSWYDGFVVIRNGRLFIPMRMCRVFLFMVLGVHGYVDLLASWLVRRPCVIVFIAKKIGENMAWNVVRPLGPDAGLRTNHDASKSDDSSCDHRYFSISLSFLSIVPFSLPPLSSFPSRLLILSSIALLPCLVVLLSPFLLKSKLFQGSCSGEGFNAMKKLVHQRNLLASQVARFLLSLRSSLLLSFIHAFTAFHPLTDGGIFIHTR